MARDSWRVLFDPVQIAKIATCGVAVVDAPSEVISAVLTCLGKDPNAESAADLAAVEKLLLAIRPFIRYINAVSPIEDLANGEVCAVLGWSGDVAQSRRRAAEAGKRLDIRYVLPKEGTLSFFDAFAIPSDAPHPQLALRFIDFMLRPEVAAQNVNAIHYATFNAAALTKLDPQLRNDVSINPSPEM